MALNDEFLGDKATQRVALNSKFLGDKATQRVALSGKFLGGKVNGFLLIGGGGARQGNTTMEYHLFQKWRSFSGDKVRKRVPLECYF